MVFTISEIQNKTNIIFNKKQGQKSSKMKLNQTTNLGWNGNRQNILEWPLVAFIDLRGQIYLLVNKIFH